MSILKKSCNFMPITYTTEVHGTKIVMSNNLKFSNKTNERHKKEYDCYFRYRPAIESKTTRTSKNNFNIYDAQLSYSFGI